MGLEVEHINKSFGPFQAITDLSLKVEEGSLLGFLGANGAGKTTTMRMVLDIFRPIPARLAGIIPLSARLRVASGAICRRSAGCIPKWRSRINYCFWHA